MLDKWQCPPRKRTKPTDLALRCSNLKNLLSQSFHLKLPASQLDQGKPVRQRYSKFSPKSCPLPPYSYTKRSTKACLEFIEKRGVWQKSWELGHHAIVVDIMKDLQRQRLHDAVSLVFANCLSRFLQTQLSSQFDAKPVLSTGCRRSMMSTAATLSRQTNQNKADNGQQTHQQLSASNNALKHLGILLALSSSLALRHSFFLLLPAIMVSHPKRSSERRL